MDLWVRSQDRDFIMQVNNINVGLAECDGCDGFEIRRLFTFMNTGQGLTSFSLGEYKSEKRTLEVLDEIQELLTNSISNSGTYQAIDIMVKSIIASNMYKLYEMPKE